VSSVKNDLFLDGGWNPQAGWSTARATGMSGSFMSL